MKRIALQSRESWEPQRMAFPTVSTVWETQVLPNNKCIIFGALLTRSGIGNLIRLRVRTLISPNYTQNDLQPSERTLPGKPSTFMLAEKSAALTWDACAQLE